MKKILFILFTLFNSSIFSQTHLPSPEHKPVFYIDSIRFQTLGSFDLDKIESISVVKDKDPGAPNGKVFITTKKNDFTGGRNAVRRKNALHDSQEIASKLYPNIN